MKQGFIILMLIITILIGWECYELVKSYNVPESSTIGSLSDIAEKATAIPLQYAGNQKFDRAHSIRLYGQNLFLVNNHTLFRFNLAGELVRQITEPEKISVATYIIDYTGNQLIVLGNTNTVHYYSFDGELTGYREFESESPVHYMKAIEMYDGYIWTAESLLRTDSVTEQKYLEEKLVKYDSSFNKIEQRLLTSADLPGKPLLPSFAEIEIGADESNRKVYAHSSPLWADYLLRDSLVLKKRKDMFSFEDEYAGLQSVYPVRFGKRFWVSSSSDYLFCFDRDTSRSWLVESLDDNFFNTGAVSKLQAMDMYSSTYCFCKSGEEVKKTFPKQAASDNTVVFVVKMKA